MMKSSMLLVLAIVALPSVSFATAMHENNQFWVSYSLPATVATKPVQSVFAHTGILRTGGSNCGNSYNEGTWDDVQLVELTLQNGHYFGKAALFTQLGQCAVAVAGPVVEYFVFYTDGTTLITSVASVATTDTTLVVRSNGTLNYEQSVQKNNEAFGLVSDTSASQALRLKYQYAD